MRWPFCGFYTSSLPENIDALEKIASILGIPDITVEEVWEMMRHSGLEEVPHMGNIYSYLLLNQIVNALSQLKPELVVDYYINGLDTHLYINGEKIYSIEDYSEMVAQADLTITRIVNHRLYSLNQANTSRIGFFYGDCLNNHHPIDSIDKTAFPKKNSFLSAGFVDTISMNRGLLSLQIGNH